MKKKKKSIILTLADLREFNEKQYSKDFVFISFQRKFRKFFKFSAIRENYFVATSKITGLSNAIEIQGNNCFEVKRSFCPYVYSLHADNAQELIQKFIKHNLY